MAKKSTRKSKRTDASVVGDLVNFRGLVYAPINETGVVFLFGKVAADLNMYVEEIKTGFPDCIARRFTGKGWERVRVEFEHKSSNFYQHGHPVEDCDIIVCWEHDWDACPEGIEVIELRDSIKELPKEDVGRPGEPEAVPQGNIREWFKRHGIQQKVTPLFDRLWDHVHGQNDSTFYKVGERLVSFYCPERVFLFLYPLKTKLRLGMFTGWKSLGKVKRSESVGRKGNWGTLSISSEAKLRAALPWVSESMRRIREAVRKNEPTGWRHAGIDPEDNE